MLRFFLTFLAIAIALFALELTPVAQKLVVLPWTELLARTSVALIKVFDAEVVSVGKVLESTRNGFAVSIEAGCNGVEAALILVAAMLAFPSPWKRKVAGIAGGLFAVQSLNIVRVVSLFYVGQWSLTAFEWAHLYLWQALIMLDVLVVWLLWLQWLRSGETSRARA